jgi:diguanylate cyclase
MGMGRSLIAEVDDEYRKVDARWLILHYRASLGLVAFAFVVECILSWVMHTTGEIHMSTSGFLLKYLVMPAVMNLMCVIVDVIVIRLPSVSQVVKIYTVSLMFVAICFILFTIHGAFSSLFFLFALPCLLTTIYVDYVLTATTAGASLCLLVFSELVLRWDPDKASVFTDGIRLGNFLISLFVLLGFFAVCAVIIYFERVKNAASVHKELERMRLQRRLLVDELTGIRNRLAFRNAIKDMEEDFSERAYIFAMIDLDNFKDLNDELGHQAGDRCLVGFADILAAVCGRDAAFRYGGDEFCLLFRDLAMKDALALCRRVQENFREFGATFPTEKPFSASFGVAPYRSGMLPSRLIANADQAMYASKANRGTITVYESLSQ